MLLKKTENSERGVFSAMFIGVMVFVLVIMALAISVTGAEAAHTRQVRIENVAKEIRMDASNLVKFSDNPGRDVSQLMVDTIRKNGYQGGIEIYFYELPKSSLPSSASPDTDRYYGTAIRLTRTYDAGFAKNFGASTWPVSSTLASVSHAYSDGKIWRPTGNSNGRYTSTSGNTIIYEQISMDKYPNELIEKLKLK